MKNVSIFLIAVALIAGMVGCGEGPSEVIPETIALPTADRIYEDPADGIRFVEDELIIRFVEGTSEETMRAVVQSVNGVFIGSIPDLNVFQVQIEIESPDDLWDIIGELEEHVSVDYATLNFILTSHTHTYPNDPGYGACWGHELIELPSAWYIGLTGDASTKIGIVDEYFNRHDDFDDNVFDADYVLEDYDELGTHGTAVGGIVGAQGDNEEAIAGVMWDCALLLYSCTDGLVPVPNPIVSHSKVVDQMNRAIKNGANIINVSGGQFSKNPIWRFLLNLLYKTTISDNPDVLFVFSVGNNDDDAKYNCPSNLSDIFDNVISVAAIQEDGDLWENSETNEGSNGGDAVTVAAPGDDIFTLSGNPACQTRGGTSFAAPFVTGLAGLIRSVDGSLSASEVKQIIINGALIGGNRVPGESFYVINAYESIRITQGFEVDFPDPNLEAVIREAIGKPTGAIYFSDLDGLTSLDARERNITDLTGLEYAFSLTYLDLAHNQIYDISPLSDLTGLIHLDIGGNQIDVISPLENLTDLTWLSLWDNQVSSILPLADLTDLTHLSLAHNQITDISPLTNLTGLTYLDLGDNQINDISLLEDFTDLTWLSLWNCQVSSISPLADLTGLIYLNLAHNQITDISLLEDFTNLTELWLNDNPISDFSPLADLTGLIHLDLGENQISDISLLENLTNLTWLSLWSCQVSSISPLADLTGLTHLSLAHNQITDISPLTNLTGLTYLDLQDNQINDISLLEDFTDLTWLSLWNCQVSSISPLADLTDLIYLNLAHNQITDVSLLEDFTNLTELWLQDNPISDFSPLASLTGLIHLDLGDNEINDISALENLINLTWLGLWNNQVTNISLLENFTNLSELWLGYNQVTDISPLVDNLGLGDGDKVNLENNPLSDTSINVYIPQLEARGVDVDY